MSVKTGEPRWRKGRRSNSQGNCVEVAALDGGQTIGVRDSKDPGGAVLTLQTGDFASLVRAIRSDQHDL